jgi:hypothetical protein
MGEGALHPEEEATVKQRNSNLGPGTKTNWPSDRRSQCNLKLNLRHCTANHRPVLSSERTPYMKNKESNCHSNKCNSWLPAPRGARHQDELADRSPYLCPPGSGLPGLPSYTFQALESLFVYSYDSQGYGGDIPTRLHTGNSVKDVRFLQRCLRRAMYPCVSSCIPFQVTASVV